MLSQGKQGLHPILNTRCEHGNVTSCCNLEKFYLVMPYAISSFSRNTWTNANYPQTCKLLLLRDSLQGLKFLHASGFMHRDIRPQNMLILSYEPPQASVCDYGKVVEAVHSIDTFIGPIHSLAPEVWTANKDSPYDAKIDMWAFG